MEVTKAAFEITYFYVEYTIRNKKSEYSHFSNKNGTAFFVIWIMMKTIWKKCLQLIFDPIICGLTILHMREHFALVKYPTS